MGCIGLCGIQMQAEALNNEIKKQVTSSWSLFIQIQKCFHYFLCTCSGVHNTQVTKFCMMAPNICGCSVWNLLHVTPVVPRILRQVPDFWKNLLTPNILVEH
jgi:hypothetical protein